MSLQCRVVHAIAGRLRVRIDDYELWQDLPAAFGGWMREQAGVQDVRLNPDCRSAVVAYDPATVNSEQLLRRVGMLSLTELRTLQEPASNGQENESSSTITLALSSVAAVLSFLGESALAPWLLLGAALPIFSRAIDSVTKKGRLNVDVLDATATGVLSLQGQFATASIMVWLVSLGDFIRDITMEQSHRAIGGLLGGKIQTAWVVRAGKVCQVDAKAVQKGDEVVVYPGEFIPVDGQVATGKATVDQAFLTGESMPVEKGPGDDVFAGTVVREGKIHLRARQIGADTMAQKIVRLVEEAPIRETRIQNYAEQFADRVVPWTLLGAGACVAAGNANAAAAVLIPDYGTGIRVAAPTTILSSMTEAARNGILVKGGGRYFETLTEVDAIVFDKTGTLTRGVLELADIRAYGTASQERILILAAAAEQRFTHPVAEAIQRAAASDGLSVPERETSDYMIGLGVQANIGEATVCVGCERFMRLKGISVDRSDNDVAELERQAASPLFVAADGELIGLLVFEDPLHAEAPGVVQALRDRGIREVVMLTGDRPQVAARVARHLGIERYVAEALPEEKVSFVKRLQEEGCTVAVVGDGINDSPALAQADVGIAVHGGTDVAWETAHVVLLEKSLWKIPHAIDIARESLRLIRQNWNLNFYPNTAAIALSLAGVLGPVGATLISNGSAVLATLNGLRPLLNGRRLDQRGHEVVHSGLEDRAHHGFGQPLRRAGSVVPRTGSRAAA
jgi:Cu2+-exporting ATPase